ncbi:MAG: preprotein translocase subunit SecD [bacterium]|jgi:preprotein translocase subunit SecD
MKFSWKGIAILAILAVTIFYDLPTFQSFLPQSAATLQKKVSVRYLDIQKSYQDLKSIQHFLAQPKQNRILVMMEKGKKFPIQSSSIQALLKKDFSFQNNYLTMLPTAGKNVFISDVTGKLNNIILNVKKIKSITIAKSKESIQFNMKKGKKLSHLSHPIKQFLNGEMGWLYDQEKQKYLSQFEKDKVINLGLDLQGGMYLDVGVQYSEVVDAVLDSLIEDLESRLTEGNVNYVSVKKIGSTYQTRKIEIDLDDLENFRIEGEKYKQVLENYDVAYQDAGSKIFLSLKPKELKRLKEQSIKQALETIRNRIDAFGVKEPSIQRQGEDSIIIQLPGIKDPARAKKLINTRAKLEFRLVKANASIESPGPDGILAIKENLHPVTKEILSHTTYVLEKKIALKGNAIRDARVTFDENGSAQVSLAFNDLGQKLFGELTSKNVNRQLAIVLDGKVQSAPNINEPILSGEASISGNFSVQEASDLSLVLRSGSLPARLVINEERTIGASLGDDSIKKSLMALVVGFCAVIIFMILYYNVSGIFSVLALIFNLLLIVAILAYFQATLTLPGMAGIILTIGMAVDANVLIFERIREEIERGNSIRRSINNGFQRATITILDSNITTIFAAIILFQFGTGPIKGFSVTLSIGILASMFTSIVVGRFLFELFYLNKKNLVKISI